MKSYPFLYLIDPTLVVEILIKIENETVPILHS